MMKYNLKRNMCTPRFFGERDYINSMEQFVDRQKDTNPRRTKKFVHDNLEKVFFEKELESVTCNISAPSKDILPDDVSTYTNKYFFVETMVTLLHQVDILYISNERPFTYFNTRNL
ncbi:hypothetical protein AX774_g1776 [Zancudomyces culisetae]|uniref:Uncharacterized protein n=1 Tax=Zancudomyces culisetae TaxID=1213189 RepID=A0A1R1PUQ2_ZANCU|nr:hypothetical protein AX774_g1776 [Zancudomyces culisetae]|eukprot:OMH84696.1 hypothetical protein AX774_g1776 [Zancudomyces culisetae]